MRKTEVGGKHRNTKFIVAQQAANPHMSKDIDPSDDEIDDPDDSPRDLKQRFRSVNQEH